MVELFLIQYFVSLASYCRAEKCAHFKQLIQIQLWASAKRFLIGLVTWLRGPLTSNVSFVLWRTKLQLSAIMSRSIVGPVTSRLAGLVKHEAQPNDRVLGMQIMKTPSTKVVGDVSVARKKSFASVDVWWGPFDGKIALFYSRREQKKNSRRKKLHQHRQSRDLTLKIEINSK